MARNATRRRLRQARVRAAAVVGALTATSLIVTATAEQGSVWRELGLALLSGAIVGGSLVIVESLLASAAEDRARREALLQLMSSTTELNGIDLSGNELDDLYLPGRGFVAADMRGVRLDRSKLLFGDFRHVDLTGCSLCGADLSGSTFAYGDLRRARMREASLRDVDLSDASLDGADLSGATVVNARLARTSLVGADLTGATFRHCILDGADLTSAVTTGTVFAGNQYDATTRWPVSLSEVPASVVVSQDAFAEMDLASYLAWRASPPSVAAD